MAHRIEEWLELRNQWILVSRELKQAYQAMDDQFNDYLLGKGPRIDQRQIEAINDLIFRQSEARGAMDQFISET